MNSQWNMVPTLRELVDGMLAFIEVTLRQLDESGTDP